MNLFRSEGHVARWNAEHGLKGVTLSIDQAREWISFIGKDRLHEDYVHPRVTGTLGPFMQSIGLTGDFWKPSGS